MSAFVKDTTLCDPYTLAARKGWEIFAPQPETGEEAPNFAGTDDVRDALRQAEAVIRAQEERIRNLENLTHTDELTGLANRRGFLGAFQRELSLARRDTDYGGLLVMMDLDGFKKINDAWGHQQGDACLYAVAETLRENVRGTDIVARIGADKFALLLVGIKELAGVRRVKKLEKLLSRKTVLSDAVPVSASFGFVSYNGASSLDTCLKTADLRLYAKKADRQKLRLTA